MNDSAHSENQPPADLPEEPIKPEILSADESLPEVQPPNSNFLIQLFVVPFLIVMAAVLLVLIPRWLNQATQGNPEDYLAELERTNHATWQSAWNLAEAMHDKKNEALKSDPAFADKLVSLLRRQLSDPQLVTDQSAVRLRCFLCRTIGSLHIDNGLPILLEAADTERDFAEIEMRIFALESLAELTDNLGAEKLQSNQQLLDILQKASLERSENPVEKKFRDQLRVRAAFALGVLGGEKALDRLASMTDDSLSDVRFNSATGLARHGDARAIPTLINMLEVKSVEEIKANSADYQRMHTTTVMSNALRAAIIMKHANHEIDTEPIEAAIDKMLLDELPLSIRDEALRTQEIFQQEAKEEEE